MRSHALPQPAALLALVIIVTLSAACGGDQPAPAATAPAPTLAAPAPTATVPTAVAQPTQAPASTAANTPAAPAPTKTAQLVATTAPTQPPKPTEKPAPAEAAPSGQAALDLFRDIAAAQAEQPTMRMRMTSVKGGTTTTMVMELVRPDRLHSSGGPGGEMLIVPEGTYLKPAGGAWQKAPYDLSDSIGDLLSQTSVEEVLQNLTVDQLRPAGAAVLNGKPCWIYAYEQTMEVMGQKIESSAKIWVGVADKLPYQSVAETETSAEPGVITTTTILYEYGLDLRIEAPLP